MIVDYFAEGRSETWREVVIEGKRYRAFVFGNRLRQASRRDIPLRGIVLGDPIALEDDPVAADGGDEGGGDPPVLPDSWTQGPKTLLYVRLVFADNPTADPQSETSCYDSINTVNDFFGKLMEYHVPHSHGDTPAGPSPN